MMYDVIKMSYGNFKDWSENGRKIFDEKIKLIPYDAEWKRIKYNSCYVVKVHDYVFLKSYNTIVAYYSTFTRDVRIYDYYSNTTSHHIYKFMHLIREAGYEIDSVLYLYERRDRIACVHNQFQCLTKWYKSLDKK